MTEVISAAARLDAEWWRAQEAKAEAAEAKTETYIEPVPEEELAILETIGRELRKRDDTIARLEERLERLEEGKARHAGTWQAGRSYGAGEFVTRSGSLWHCKRDFATGEPGASADWKLTVKRGEAK
jgi:hypothetical protein